MSAPAGYNLTKTPNMSPEAMKMLQSMTGGMGGMEKMMQALMGMASGEGAAFAPMEQKAQKDFSQMMGQTSSRFSQLGARGSSAFEGAVAQGGADLASKLAEQRASLSSDAINKLLGFSGQILGAKPYEYQLQEEDQGFDWGAAGAGAVKALPDIIKLVKLLQGG